MDLAKLKQQLEQLAKEGLSEEELAAAGKAPEAEIEEDPKAKAKKDASPRLNGLIETDYAARGFHLDAQVNQDQVVQAAEILDQHEFTLEAVTGVDWIKENQFEIVYDYAYTGGKLLRTVVRARVAREQPDIPTISAVYPGANWHERETWDLFGINFVGHPQLERFLLPDDCDFHPLRKDFQP